MSKKWRGPWIGQYSSGALLPASGDFSIRPSALDSSNWAVLLGTVLGAVQPGVEDASIIECGSSTAALARFTCDPDTCLYLDYAGSPTPVSMLPLTFTITSLIIQVSTNLPRTGDIFLQFSVAHEVDPLIDANYPAALPAIAALVAEGMGVRADCGVGEVVTIGTTTDPAGDGALVLIGTYTT